MWTIGRNSQPQHSTDFVARDLAKGRSHYQPGRPAQRDAGRALTQEAIEQELPCATDITLIPYHGQHEEDDKHIRRGMAKGSTTHFHGYDTFFVVKNNKRYTLVLTFVYQTDKALDVLKRLLLIHA